MNNEPAESRNFTIFLMIWVGQILSIFGSAVAEFGITLWAYETTGRATPLAMIGVFYTVPMLALSPFAGVWVDRYNRKLMMMLSDLSAALVSLIVLILLLNGSLQIWHLYLTAVITGVFQGFHWPAYSAAISTMLPKKHYGRANGMMEMAGPASGNFAPMVAGALIGPFGLKGLLMIDLALAGFAILALLFVWKHPPVQLFFTQVFRQRPAQPSFLGPFQIFSDGAVGNLAGPCYGPVRHPRFTM